MTSTLTAEQTAARLGVKLATVYAYVSRGVLSREVADDGRTSRFDHAEVESLARRGRPRAGSPRVGSIDVSLATSVTGILAGGRLVYRGHDVATLATEATFEQVAELLWTGELAAPLRWPDPIEAEPVARTVRDVLPSTSPATERFAAAVAMQACNQPLRADLRPEAVVRNARLLVVTLGASLPVVAVPAKRTRSRAASGRSRPPRFAHRLWSRVSPLLPTAARVKVLETALILLADHELATSTLAARVAASTRADPYAVVLAGLGAVSGPLHGKAALGTHQLLLDARAAPDAAIAVGRALSRTPTLPGFGHTVYVGIDPRAACLLERLAPIAKRTDLEVIAAVQAAAASGGGPAPTVDFALGALAFATAMPIGSTEAIFAMARTVGWIAHALEEYDEAPLRFRSRAIYVGAQTT